MPVALLYICDSPYQIDLYLLHGVFKASQQGGLTYFSASNLLSQYNWMVLCKLCCKDVNIITTLLRGKV